MANSVDDDERFLMAIEDVYSRQGHECMVEGPVERGELRVGDDVEIVGSRPTRQVRVVGVMKFKKLLDRAAAGDTFGLIFRGMSKDDIERGEVVARPGSIKPHTKFKAKIDMLTKEESGRDTLISTGHKPQFYFRTFEVPGVVKLPTGTERIVPGDKNIEVEIELSSPVALERDLRFGLREGGKTVGTGIITEIKG
jgi:elongation factor Tu